MEIEPNLSRYKIAALFPDSPWVLTTDGTVMQWCYFEKRPEKPTTYQITEPYKCLVMTDGNPAMVTVEGEVKILSKS